MHRINMTILLLSSLGFSLTLQGSNSPCEEALADLAGEHLSSGHRTLIGGPFRGIEVIGNIQATTRGRELRLGRETFRSSEIDFSSALQHVQIHTSGEIAGSQFDGFQGPQQVVEFLQAALPPQIHYDQFGRAEVTLQMNRNIGFTGVISKAELATKHPGTAVQSRQRMPGGTPGEFDGIRGAWFAEMERGPDGTMIVKLGSDGRPANPHFKFEPVAQIAEGVVAVPTNKVTVVIQKSKDGRPQVVTMFPGDNAPAFPARIEQFNVDSLAPDSPERRFWDSHVFLRP
jgi:hypothetical protein